MLVDSHHHLWKYSEAEYGWISEEMSVLRRDFLLAELRSIASESGVDGFVSVQARQSIEETEALLAMSEFEPLIRGVVGWVPLADPDVGKILDRFSDHAALKGIRHVVQDEPDDQFLLGSAFNRGIEQLNGRDLVYDVLIFPRQLPAAIEFVDRHSTLTMVLDHLAKPVIQPSEFDTDWEKGFRELARRPNVTCKFSGVLTEIRDDAWTIDTVRPYWDIALDAFSPKRLMFGSDWPVCLLRADHASWLRCTKQLASELSADEQSDFFANTAISTYALDISTP